MESNSQTWYCTEFGITDYGEIQALQLELVEARKKRTIDRDVILILEHRPVFTLGRRGGRENLTVTPEFLEKSGVQVVQAERGGNITYHGPGQIIGYPIVDLYGGKIKVVDFVGLLEDVMIRTAADFGIAAGQDPRNRGVWVGGNKLGSVGIAVRRGVSFHGFALNVNLALEPFDWINPCGLTGIGVTSMKRELSQELPMDRVRETVKKNIETVFDVRLEMKTDLA